MPATVTPTLAMLRVQGQDASKFLQGQLSSDMTALRAEQFRPAGLHSPQGRVIALLWLTAPSAQEILALLPQDVAPLAAAALRRFVLRARVSIEVAAANSTLYALPGAPPSTAAGKILAIAAGVPQVYAASSGQFVAQMLNLDCIEAIAFNKGRYTGQEIIARAHYRGRVKRRMQRFAIPHTLAPQLMALAPGAALRLPDGRPAQLVDAALLADGSCELLAVAPLRSGAAEAGPPLAAAAAGAGAPGAESALTLTQCLPLPLPYAPPE